MYTNHNFEGKHEDEKILHFCQTSGIQLKFELIKIIIPFIFIIFVFSLLFYYNVISLTIFLILITIVFFLFIFSFFYKIYRYRHNFLYITSKRILFHGIEGFFKDYVKKINYENIRNINFFTESFIGRIFKYGTLEIQSSHGGLGDITIYHINNGKMLTHYIDKIISLSSEERQNFKEFNPDYFKDWKK